MSTRFFITNQTERIVASRFTHTLRNEPPTSRLRLLFEATIGPRDQDWFAAYQEEERRRTRYGQASRVARAEVDAMMNVARRFFRGVYDRDGHSVPRVLATCMNGSTPSELENAGFAERVRALRSLSVMIRGYPELHCDPAVLGELTVAVQHADQALQGLDLARRAWREAVNRKQDAATDFDQTYRGFANAARAIGFRDELPAFVDQEQPEAEDADPSTVPPDIELGALPDNDPAGEE